MKFSSDMICGCEWRSLADNTSRCDCEGYRARATCKGARQGKIHVVWRIVLEDGPGDDKFSRVLYRTDGDGRVKDGLLYRLRLFPDDDRTGLFGTTGGFWLALTLVSGYELRYGPRGTRERGADG